MAGGPGGPEDLGKPELSPEVVARCCSRGSAVVGNWGAKGRSCFSRRGRGRGECEAAMAAVLARLSARPCALPVGLVLMAQAALRRQEEQGRPTQLGEPKIFSCRILKKAFVHTPREEMYSRRILLHTPFSGQPSGPSQPVSGATIVEGGSPGSNFDANIVMILAVLLCALICALGLNSIVRCALRCSSRMVVDPEPSRVTRLAQSGLRRKALRSMPILLYSTGLKLNTVSPMCAICLSDFEDGEHVRVLPKCNHGFHVRCIDRWLLARSTCPTCRQSLFGAPQKASGCSESEGSQAEPVPALPVLAPLRPEGLVTPYDF
uniref:RING-type domain-containing protein n=1 Tax=Oryza meridionalis TaxID=40149 RepID=A0A0E0DE45_9ORYZ